jgi:tubulin--tyrosine ligase
MNLGKLKVLVGIDEKYTRQKIIDCFKYRTEYEVHELDKESQNNESQLHNYNIYWLEYEDLDFERFLNKTASKENNLILLNSFCIRKGLIRKAQIAYYLKKYLSKKGDSPLAKYLPETYVFELDYIDYLDEALNDVFEVEQALNDNLTKANTKKFILKSSMTNKGAEMLLFDTKKQLVDFFQRRVDNSEDETLDLREWVIQAYIDNPLQLESYNKRKFHLRVYVVAVGSLKVFVYDDILALFCRDKYKNEAKLSDDENLDLKCHITNTCFQLENLDKNNNEWQKAEEECVKRFWQLNLDESDPIKNELKLNFIYDQVKECVGKVFECLFYEPTVFQPLENAFELYGFDFLVDQNMNTFFLEANAFPDFKQTGDSLNDLIDCLFYQTVAVACDDYFGVGRVCDPNKLFLVYEKNK